MLKGLGDIGNIMKLQKELKSLQKKLKKMESEAQSKDGAVIAVVNGEFEVVKLKFTPNATGTPDQIAASCKEAINNAVEENKRVAAEKMKELTGGMNIPGMDGLL